MAKSYSQLLQEKERIEAAIEAARRRESAGVIKRMREAIIVYGISAKDLGFNADGLIVTETVVSKRTKTAKPKTKPKAEKVKAPEPKTRKRAIKYSDGNGHTWAGGGSMPVWLREQLDAGKKLEDFRVEKKAA